MNGSAPLAPKCRAEPFQMSRNWPSSVSGAGASLIATAALVLGAPESLAQPQSGICVVCSEPSASYSCVIAEAGDPNLARGGERAAHFVCVTELAKLGGHASCRVRRDFSTHCDAPQRVVSVKGLVEPAPAAVAASGGGAPTDPSTPQGQPAPAPPQGPPQTLEELAKRTAAESGVALKKTGTAVVDGAKSAGSAVGGALQQTWTCVTSLFTSCKKPE